MKEKENSKGAAQGGWFGSLFSLISWPFAIFGAVYNFFHGPSQPSNDHPALLPADDVQVPQLHTYTSCPSEESKIWEKA